MKRTSEQVDPGEAAPVRWGPTLRAVRGYYDATTERSFLSGWSGEGMGLHFGLDGDGEGTHARSLERTNEAVVDALALTADDRCLDAGCGVGGTAIHVARRVGARVLGVTLSERQAELARGFAGEAGVGDRAAFVVADYGATGLAAGTFDAVWLLESFCHAESPGAVLRHLSGLLRPGGRLVCVDMLRGEGGDSDNLRDLCEGWVLPSLRSLAELEALATRAGLDAVPDRRPHAAGAALGGDAPPAGLRAASEAGFRTEDGGRRRRRDGRACAGRARVRAGAPRRRGDLRDGLGGAGGVSRAAHQGRVPRMS